MVAADVILAVADGTIVVLSLSAAGVPHRR